MRGIRRLLLHPKGHLPTNWVNVGFTGHGFNAFALQGVTIKLVSKALVDTRTWVTRKSLRLWGRVLLIGLKSPELRGSSLTIAIWGWRKWSLGKIFTLLFHWDNKLEYSSECGTIENTLEDFNLPSICISLN